MQDIYTKNHKKMMIIPILLLIPLLIGVLFYPGILQGIDLTGGNVLMIRTQKTLDTIQVEKAILEEFNLSEISVSVISSPGTNGVYIKYNKDAKVLEAEKLIENAQTLIEQEKESEAMAESIQAIFLLTQENKTFANAKLALNAAQEALIQYNENFSKRIRETLSEKLGLESTAEFSQREVSPTFGQAALASGIFIVSISAVLLFIIVFIFFRQVIPVLGIVFAMIFDVIFGLFGMAIFGIPLSLLTIATLLMVVGYSVDTNIMLTSRMIKERDHTPGERATASLKTGLTMSATSLAALIPMIIISAYYQIDIVFQIAIILTFGLFGDIIATWLMNASILIWFVEKKVKQ